MRSRPQLYRDVFAGGEEIPRFGGNCRRITGLNWQFSATGGGSTPPFIFLGMEVRQRQVSEESEGRLM